MDHYVKEQPIGGLTGTTGGVGGLNFHHTASAAGGSKSVFFSGDEWLKASDSDLSIGTGAFTIEFWANFDTNAGNNTLNCVLETRSGGGSTSDGIMIARWTYTGTHINRVSVYMNGFLIEESGTTSLNTWNHWALVRNGTTLTLYKDGTNVASGTGYNNNWTNTEWFIGTLQNESASSSPTNEMRGYVSNFRFSKAAVYTSNFTAPTEPLGVLGSTELLCCNQDSTSDPVTESTGVSLTDSQGTTGNSPSVENTSPF